METNPKIIKILKENKTLQETKGKIQYKIDSSFFMGVKGKEKKQKNIQKISSHIEANENKIKTIRFKDTKKVPKDVKSPKYLKYLLAVNQNEIDDINSKLPSMIKTINYFRELKLKYYQTQRLKIQKKLETLMSEIQEKTNKVKGVLQDNKESPKEESKGTPFSLSTSTSDKPKSSGENTSEQANNQKTSTVGLTSEDIKNLQNLDITQLDTLVGIHKEILQKLTKIEANMVDEQDTSIKTSETKPTNEVIKVSEKDEKKEETSWWKRILGMVTMIAIPFIVKYFKKFTKGLFKNFFKMWWSAMKTSYSVLWKFMKIIGKFGIDSLTKLGSYLWEGTKNKISKMLAPFTEQITKLKAFIQPFVDKIKNIGKTIKDVVMKIIGKPAELLNKAKDAVKDKVSNLWGFVKDKATKVSKSVVETAQKGKDLIKNSKVGKIVGKGLGKLGKFAGELGGKTIKFGKGMVQKISKEAGGAVLKKILPFVGKVIGTKGLKALTTAGKIIPGGALLIGAGFALKKAIEGDYPGAALELLSGLVGSIPGVGPLLGIALSVGGGIILNKMKKNKKKEIKVQNKFPTELQSTSINNPTAKQPMNKWEKIQDRKARRKWAQEHPGENYQQNDNSAGVHSYNKSVGVKTEKNNTWKVGIGKRSLKISNKGENKDINIVYRYHSNQKYIWNEVDLIDMFKRKENGETVQTAMKYIPHDNIHLKSKTTKINKTSTKIVSLNNIENTKKSSREAFKDKMKNAINIGEGVSSDFMFGVGKNKDLDVIYKYNPNQLYKFTESEIIQKAQDLKDGKDIKEGLEFIPKDKQHLNPNANKEILQVQPNKEPMVLQKNNLISNITSLTPVQGATTIIQQAPSANPSVPGNHPASNFDNNVKLSELFNGANRF